MELRFRVDGASELGRRLEALPLAVRRQTALAALTEAAEPMRAQIAALAPRSADPKEHLADHIGISAVTAANVSRGGHDPETDFAVRIGPTRNFFYGLFRELGTRHEAAAPFVRPGFESEREAALQILADELWWAVRHGLDTF